MGNFGIGLDFFEFINLLLICAERSVLLLVILEFGNIWQTHGINIDFTLCY